MISCIDYVLLSNNLIFICVSIAIDSGNVFKAESYFQKLQ